MDALTLPHARTRKTAPLGEVFWLCGVVRSGYHAGVHCGPEDPHGGWGCGWYREALVEVDVESRYGD